MKISTNQFDTEIMELKAKHLSDDLKNNFLLKKWLLNITLQYEN